MRPARGDGEMTGLRYCGLAGLAALAAVSPLLFAGVPPLVDYPAHLAQVRIFCDLLTAGQYATAYRLDVGFIPNLAMYGVVGGLHLAGVPLELAGRLFVGAIVLGLGFAAAFLHGSVFRRRSVVPLLAFAWVYSAAFRLGLMNYLTGLVLVMLCLGMWLRLRDGKIMTRAAVCGAMMPVLFFCHLTAALLFLALVCVGEGGECCVADGLPVRRRVTRAGGRCAALLVPVFILVLLVKLAPISPRPAAVADTVWRTLEQIHHQAGQRLWMILHGFDGYDHAIGLGGALCVAVAMAIGAWRRCVVVSWPLAAGVLSLCLLCLIIPSPAAGLAYTADRLPAAIVLLMAASVDIRPASARGRAALAALVLLVVGSQAGAAIATWRAADHAYAPIIAALDRLPPHSVLLTQFRTPHFYAMSVPFDHLAGMAAVRGTVFDTGVWAERGQDPIAPNGTRFALALRLSNELRRRADLPADAFYRNLLYQRCDAAAMRPTEADPAAQVCAGLYDFVYLDNVRLPQGIPVRAGVDNVAGENAGPYLELLLSSGPVAIYAVRRALGDAANGPVSQP